MHGIQTAAPEAIDLQLIAASHNLPPSESHDVFAGIRLAPGSDARRRLANLPGEDMEKLRRLATRRRQMRVLIEQSQGDAAWAAQVSHLTDDLDPTSAGELLFELAEGYRAAGKLDLAADTYSSLARSQPQHPLVEPALRWLVQFYASSETAQRLADHAAQNYRARPTPDVSANAVQQASAVTSIDVGSTPVIGLSRENRLERAKALGAYLEAARPSLFADPSVRFPLVVAERKRGFANPAQRYYLTLRSLPENDPWRRCAETEQWFAKPGESPPPKPLGNCRRATERPHLDGKFDEPFWKSADHLPLKRGQNDLTPATIRFTCDAEFLYLAIECPKAKGVDYPPDDRPRSRDADLSAHDRVVIRLDVDRDYTTAYELAIDSRGWTRDACWGDATWNPTWYVAATADDSTWTAEAAIPLVGASRRAARGTAGVGGVGRADDPRRRRRNLGRRRDFRRFTRSVRALDLRVIGSARLPPDKTSARAGPSSAPSKMHLHEHPELQRSSTISGASGYRSLMCLPFRRGRGRPGSPISHDPDSFRRPA